MRFLSRLLPHKPNWSLRFAEDGFLLERDGTETDRLVWADVREIVTFKRDLVTVDSICLAFRTGPKPLYLEVCEEMEGFDRLIDEMQKRFPAIPEDWLPEVTQPPFATNERRLFGDAPEER